MSLCVVGRAKTSSFGVLNRYGHTVTRLCWYVEGVRVCKTDFHCIKTMNSGLYLNQRTGELLHEAPPTDQLYAVNHS